MKNDYWKITGFTATVVIVLMIPLSLVIHQPVQEISETEAGFVGGEACIECHQKEYNSWKDSDHDKAMEIATDSTVLGDFNNAEFIYNSKIHKFYKRDKKFFVFTDGPKGGMEEFQITHTFGVRPLQQYLVPFENGKYQCLPISWDTENNKWFHLVAQVYPNENIRHNNWLHWTNQGQNWNGMCAECHSTNLQKNYNYEKKTFNTTWSDIDVNCEACHGPGSEHVDWAQLPEMARSYENNLGLVVKTSNITSKQLVDLCAPCHSRRTSLGDYDHHKSSLMDNIIPQLPTVPLYFIDGQILEEDYVYGSFTQSKMYMNDVQCSDCHDSHSIKLKFEGNELCTQCHLGNQYDTYDHHFHKQAGQEGNPVLNKHGEKIEVGEGSKCINCHMPGRYFMGIDYRRDHSLRNPRPDLTIKLETPNACNDCHSEETPQWSQSYLDKWYGLKRKPHYASILAAASELEVGADSNLIMIFEDDLYPEIIRATAVQYLTGYQTVKAGNTIRSALNDPEPVVRHTAVSVFLARDTDDLAQTLLPLLNDPVKAVRIQAASKLTVLQEDQMNEIQRRAFKSALKEYENAMRYTADFPAGRFNLGNLYSNLGDAEKALEYYSQAIDIDSLFFPAKANLALLYYSTSQADKAELLYKDMIKNHPQVSQVHYNLGLLYAEQKKYHEATEQLEIAALKIADNQRIYYNLGLIYQFLNQADKAEHALLKAHLAEKNNFDFLYALIDHYLKEKNIRKAQRYASTLKKQFPDNPNTQNIVKYVDQLSQK